MNDSCGLYLEYMDLGCYDNLDNVDTTQATDVSDSTTTFDNVTDATENSPVQYDMTSAIRTSIEEIGDRDDSYIAAISKKVRSKCVSGRFFHVRLVIAFYRTVLIMVTL